MKKRYYQILTILDQKYPNQWVKGMTLSREMDVSSRTIRTDIGEINEFIPGMIQSHTHKGYRLDRKKYAEFQAKRSPYSEQTVPERPEERVSWILRNVLLHSEGIESEALENQLFISTSTLDADIAQMKKLLKGYKGISLHRRKDRLILEGMEYAKRKLYRDLLTSEIQGEFINLNRLATLYPNFDMVAISNLFDETVRDMDYTIRSSLIPILLVHIGIAVDRMMEGYTVCEHIEESVDTQSLEWKVAQQFLGNVSKHLNITIPTEEVVMMTKLLKGYRTIEDARFSIQHSKLVVLVKEILLEVKHIVGIDFCQDTEFIYGLCVHLQGVMERIQNQIYVPNVLLKNTKYQYPLIFDMAVYIGNRLSNKMGVEIQEEEVGFIALHLGACYARLAHTKKQRAVLIGTINENLKKLVVEKIHMRFKDRIEIVETLPYFEESNIVEQAIDVMISFTEVTHKLPIETVVITPFFSEQDEITLFKVLNELEKRQSNMDLNMMIGKFVQERFFYSCLDVQTPTEAITYMVQQLQQHRIVEDSFLQSCLEREACSATSFEYSIAIPHPLVLNSRQSVISVAHLATPIEWGNTRVEMVILLALNESDREFMSVFFEWLARILSEKEEISHLVSITDRDEWIQYVVRS